MARRNVAQQLRGPPNPACVSGCLFGAQEPSSASSHCLPMELPSIPATVMPEAQVRGALRAHQGDGLEAWMADQAWQAAEDGSWRVEPDRDARPSEWRRCRAEPYG